MYGHWGANAAVALGTIGAIVACALLHYEGLVFIQRRISRSEDRHRRTKVLHAVLLLMLLHVIEVWLFGATAWALLQWPEAGRLEGAIGSHLFDYVYFSAMCYTTVGFGDIAPVGPIRFLAGTEALVGLVMITWSASFTYLEMERFWRR